MTGVRLKVPSGLVVTGASRVTTPVVDVYVTMTGTPAAGVSAPPANLRAVPETTGLAPYATVADSVDSSIAVVQARSSPQRWCRSLLVRRWACRSSGWTS